MASETIRAGATISLPPVEEDLLRTITNSGAVPIRVGEAAFGTVVAPAGTLGPLPAGAVQVTNLGSGPGSVDYDDVWVYAQSVQPGAQVDAFLPAASGGGDDTAAIQAAVSGVASGTRLKARPGQVYTINDTITFTVDNVTLDLNGAAIRPGAARAGNLLSLDRMFDFNNRTGCRLTNGRFAAPLSNYTAGDLFAARISVYGTRCRVDNIRMDPQATGTSGALAYIALATDCVVEDCSCDRAAINSSSSTGSVIRNNIITNSPGDAIRTIGYSGTPQTACVIEGNTIRGQGLMGIEDQSPDGAQYIPGTIIRGNRIGPPAAGGTFGISAVGAFPTVENNTILECTSTAIESSGAGDKVIGNTIRSAAFRAGAVGIIADSAVAAAGVESGSTITGNTIHNCGKGIYVTSASFSAEVVVAANVISDPDVGIDISPLGGTAEGHVVANNVIRFSRTATANRQGIKTFTGAVLTGNRIQYTAASYAAGKFETAIYLVGSDVTMVGNTVDGGGRGDGQVVASAVGGTSDRWMMLANRFFNGATLDLTGFRAVISRGNVGFVNAPSLTVAAGASNGTGPPAPTCNGAEEAGLIAFGSGSVPGAGAQVTVTFPTARTVAPTVTLNARNASAANLGLYVSAVSTAGFTISSTGAPTASQVTGTYLVDFLVR